MHLTVQCTGVSPMLMHAMSDEQLIALWEKRKAPKGAARPSIHDACKACLYLDAAGSIVMPTPNIYSALAEAGRHVRLERQTIWRWRQEGKVPAGRRFRDKQVIFTADEAEKIRDYANRMEPLAPQDTEDSPLDGTGGR